MTSENKEMKYRVDTSTMQYKREWNILCSLAKKLIQSHIPFKVDGKAMIFAHGLEFPLDKICLTFKWKDEEDAKHFFHHDEVAQCTKDGFK